MPSGVCDTASCKVWPACSGTSERTSIDRLAIAICTRLSARIFSTWALITVPGCNTRPDATPWAVITGTVGLTDIGMIAVSLSGER